MLISIIILTNNKIGFVIDMYLNFQGRQVLYEKFV